MTGLSTSDRRLSRYFFSTFMTLNKKRHVSEQAVDHIWLVRVLEVLEAPFNEISTNNIINSKRWQNYSWSDVLVKYIWILQTINNLKEYVREQLSRGNMQTFADFLYFFVRSVAKANDSSRSQC